MSDRVLAPNPGFHGFPFPISAKPDWDPTEYAKIPYALGVELFWRLKKAQVDYSISAALTITGTGTSDDGTLDSDDGWTPEIGDPSAWASGDRDLVSPITGAPSILTRESQLLYGTSAAQSGLQLQGMDYYPNSIKAVSFRPTINGNSFYHFSDRELYLRTDLNRDFGFPVDAQSHFIFKMVEPLLYVPVLLGGGSNVSLIVTTSPTPDSDSGKFPQDDPYNGFPPCWGRMVTKNLGQCGTLDLLGCTVPLFASLEIGVFFVYDEDNIFLTGDPASGWCSLDATLSGLEWWPYKNSNGQAVWDSSTGDNLAGVS